MRREIGVAVTEATCLVRASGCRKRNCRVIIPYREEETRLTRISLGHEEEDDALLCREFSYLQVLAFFILERERW